jgi:hypothetical protein
MSQSANTPTPSNDGLNRLNEAIQKRAGRRETILAVTLAPAKRLAAKTRVQSFRAKNF